MTKPARLSASLARMLSACGAASAATLFLALAAVPAAASPDCQSDPVAGIDWQECDKKLLILSGNDLSGANLFGVDFTSTDLRDTNLLAANLEKATLVRASLAGSNAKGAKFDRIEAYRTNFSGMDAQGAVFAGAEMQRSNFKDANLTDVDFTKSELGRAQFDGATITGTKFPLANLARADFRTAKFTGPIDFNGAFFFLARLEGVDLSAATGLAQWQIDMACGDDKTVLPAGLQAPASWPCKFDQD